MDRIRLIKLSEDLDWYVSPNMSQVCIEFDKITKYEIYKWLENTTKGKVIINNYSYRPTQGQLNWGAALLGSETLFRFFFENPNDAMLFKLRWS